MSDILAILRLLQTQDPQLPVLCIFYGDPRIDWSIMACDAGLPALPRGQAADCRWPQPDGSALHAQWHADRVLFHLDRFDPARSPLRHLFGETNFGPGAMFGSIVGAVLGGPFGALAGLALGGGLSAVASPPRFTSVWTLDEVEALCRQ